MVHFRLRRECLTVNSIRSLGGVESCHSATTTGGQARNSHDHKFQTGKQSYLSSFTAIIKCKIMCL